MKEKLLAAWSFIQPWLAKGYSWSPFAMGILAGYFGKPIIKFAVDCAVKAVKLLVTI